MPLEKKHIFLLRYVFVSADILPTNYAGLL